MTDTKVNNPPKGEKTDDDKIVHEEQEYELRSLDGYLRGAGWTLLGASAAIMGRNIIGPMIFTVGHYMVLAYHSMSLPECEQCGVLTKMARGVKPLTAVSIAFLALGTVILIIARVKYGSKKAMIPGTVTSKNSRYEKRIISFAQTGEVLEMNWGGGHLVHAPKANDFPVGSLNVHGEGVGRQVGIGTYVKAFKGTWIITARHVAAELYKAANAPTTEEISMVKVGRGVLIKELILDWADDQVNNSLTCRHTGTLWCSHEDPCMVDIALIKAPISIGTHMGSALELCSEDVPPHKGELRYMFTQRIARTEDGIRYPSGTYTGCLEGLTVGDKFKIFYNTTTYPGDSGAPSLMRTTGNKYLVSCIHGGSNIAKKRNYSTVVGPLVSIITMLHATKDKSIINGPKPAQAVEVYEKGNETITAMLVRAEFDSETKREMEAQRERELDAQEALADRFAFVTMSHSEMKQDRELDYQHEREDQVDIWTHFDDEDQQGVGSEDKATPIDWVNDPKTRWSSYYSDEEANECNTAFYKVCDTTVVNTPSRGKEKKPNFDEYPALKKYCLEKGLDMEMIKPQASFANELASLNFQAKRRADGIEAFRQHHTRERHSVFGDCADYFASQLKYDRNKLISTTDDYDAAFKRSVRNIMLKTKDSNPGVPLATSDSFIGQSVSFADSNKNYNVSHNGFWVHKDGGLDKLHEYVNNRIKAISNLSYQDIKEMTPENRYKNGLYDPCRVFIKGEPHPAHKVKDSRFRLIFATSIVDQMIDRMLCEWYTDAIKAPWAEEAPESLFGPGIGFTPEYINTFTDYMTPRKKGLFNFCADVSGWDWAQKYVLQMRMKFAFCKLIHADSRWHASMMLKLEELRAWPVFVLSAKNQNPNLMHLPEPGIMASGRFETGFMNTAIQTTSLRYAAVLSAKSKLKPEDVRAIAQGDDGAVQLSKTQVEKFKKVYTELGYILKDLTPAEGDCIEFCSHMINMKSKKCYLNSLVKLFSNFVLGAKETAGQRALDAMRELKDHPDTEVIRLALENGQERVHNSDLAPGRQ